LRFGSVYACREGAGQVKGKDRDERRRLVQAFVIVSVSPFFIACQPGQQNDG